MLLAGAQEVDTYEKGQKASKSLAKIMKDPSMSKLIFQSHPDTMIPDHLPLPSMVQETIDVPEFHLSQVGGNVVASKTSVNRGISSMPSLSIAARGLQATNAVRGVGALSLHSNGTGIEVSRTAFGQVATDTGGLRRVLVSPLYFQRDTSRS